MSVTMKNVQFVVQGEALMLQARELMEEGEWRGALEKLHDTLQGMSYEQAISVLEGDMKLEGQGDVVSMVPEEPEVRKALQARYAESANLGGYFRHENRMYQAYKVVDNLGPEDATPLWNWPELAGGLFRVPSWMGDLETVHRKACYPRIFPARSLEKRALFYAHRPDLDIARMLLGSDGKWVVVLFEQVPLGIAPFWREKQNHSPEVAFSQMEPYLSVTGFARHFGYLHPNEAPANKRVPENPTPSQEEREEFAARLERENAAQVVREEERVAEIQRIRSCVIEYADSDEEYGWFDYTWKSTVPGKANLQVRAPHRALRCFALSTTSALKQMPEYSAFSPSGLKLYEDNPYHTDVWLGCGFEIDDKAYDRDNPQYLAVIDLMFEFQKKLLNFEVQVLARGPSVSGRVVFHDSPDIKATDILVIPHAGVEFEVQALKAGAVICEVGGRLAHLVIVCRELARPIIRMEDALSKFSPGQAITVIPSEGKIEIARR